MDVVEHIEISVTKAQDKAKDPFSVTSVGFNIYQNQFFLCSRVFYFGTIRNLCLRKPRSCWMMKRLVLNSLVRHVEGQYFGVKPAFHNQI